MLLEDIKRTLRKLYIGRQSQMKPHITRPGSGCLAEMCPPASLPLPDPCAALLAPT